MKHLPLLGVLLAGVFFLGAGCGSTTTEDTTTDTTGGATTGDTATQPAEGAVITVTEPASGATISSPFAINITTKKADQTVYIRVKDANGKELVTGEGEPNTEGVYKAPYMMFFGGEGDKGTVEVFHKDGTTETDLVSIPVNLE